ncbi:MULTISPECIES: septum formation initiator family protein [Pseudonocardia]|uniref:Cell division protein FtsB n=1 Tax=Pseudonocardia oroxyli TaxID=366584 RepID=A0A1G7S622_PSEOR|nr:MULTISPECIES: septum formation initiator family protein [Pseudonocardia]MCF7551260.1 septum formation initiator family protein [Pseudonocardia sp. WMMC193]SDG18402.1 Cell division protein FtsB [Pseudonocardia oroxyli]
MAGSRERTPRGTGRSRPASSARRAREPQLTRSRARATGVVAATTGLLGLSSTRRAAILAIVVCALALTVAVPLRNYVSQRQDLAAVTAQQQALRAEVEELNAQKARLSNPDEVAAEARSRLGYVRPGEVPYVVELPNTPSAEEVEAARRATPWYRTLWTDVTAGAPR